MSKKGKSPDKPKKRKLRAKKKANHGKKPNCGRG